MAHNESARDQITKSQYQIIYMSGIPSHPQTLYAAVPGPSRSDDMMDNRTMPSSSHTISSRDMPSSTHTVSSRNVLRDLTPCPLEVSHFRVQPPSSASRSDHMTYGGAARADHMTYGGAARVDHMTYGRSDHMTYGGAARSDHMTYGRSDHMTYGRSDHMRDSTLVSHLTPKSSHPFLHLKTSAEVYAKAYELHQKGSPVFVNNICEKCYKENRVRCPH